MNPTVKLFLRGAVALSMTIPTLVHAAPSKPAKMTCAEFIALDDVAKPKVVYWAEGFNKNGKPVDSAVDVDGTDKLVPVLVSECKSAPKDTLSKRVLAHAAKPAAAAQTAPKPMNMTCNEFIALDDVVKPKVVYWGEGFNKKGKPIDSVVDVGETDKLVPVLVTECKATPQVNFWQNFMKHLI